MKKVNICYLHIKEENSARQDNFFKAMIIGVTSDLLDQLFYLQTHGVMRGFKKNILIYVSAHMA